MSEKYVTSMGEGDQETSLWSKTDVEIGQSFSLSGSAGSSTGNGLLARFLHKIELEPQPGSFAPGRWSNKPV